VIIKRLRVYSVLSLLVELIVCVNRNNSWTTRLLFR